MGSTFNERLVNNCRRQRLLLKKRQGFSVLFSHRYTRFTQDCSYIFRME